MNKVFLLFFLLFSFCINAQVLVKGKLLLEDFSTTKISVFNKNSGQTIQTDSRGIFEMEMSENDTLTFFQNATFFDNLVVPNHVIEKKALRYFLKKEGYHLDELIIDNASFFDFGGKKLTREEKFEHQNSIKPVYNNSVGITTDGIFNRLFGRSKKIKKIIALENMERDFKEFKFVYTDDILMKQFKIPKDQVDAFVYFIVALDGFDYRTVSMNEEYQMFVLTKKEEFEKE